MTLLAVVLGGADTVWKDLEQLRLLREPDLVFATNDAGATYTGAVNYWCSLHVEKMNLWRIRRQKNGNPPAEHFVFHRNPSGRELQGLSDIDYHVTGDWKGSSGLFAVKVALELDLQKIVLCGVPMDQAGRHYFDTRLWAGATRHWAPWVERKEELVGKVRSMSGLTKQLLGEPDRVWLTT